MARQTFNLGPFTTPASGQWQTDGTADLLFNAAFFDTTDPRYLVRFNTRPSGQIWVYIQPTDSFSGTGGHDFSAQFEAHGRITVESGGQTLLVDFPLSDATESYEGTPSNPADVTAFYNAYVAGTDVVVTFDDRAVDPTVRAFGDVLIVGSTTRRFYRYANGAWDAGIAMPSGETNPLGITVDPNTGDVLIVGTSTDRFYRYSNGAWDAGIAVPAGETVPEGIIVDPDTGDVLIVGVTTDRFYRYSNGAWDAGIAVPSWGN